MEGRMAGRLEGVTAADVERAADTLIMLFVIDRRKSYGQRAQRCR
jgi:hypothetical protein